MTYPDDVEKELKRMERRFGIGTDRELVQLTEEDRECLEALFRDPDFILSQLARP